MRPPLPRRRPVAALVSFSIILMMIMIMTMMMTMMILPTTTTTTTSHGGYCDAWTTVERRRTIQRWHPPPPPLRQLRHSHSVAQPVFVPVVVRVSVVSFMSPPNHHHHHHISNNENNNSSNNMNNNNNSPSQPKNPPPIQPNQRKKKTSTSTITVPVSSSPSIKSRGTPVVVPKKSTTRSCHYQTWRVYGITVHPDQLVRDDDYNTNHQNDDDNQNNNNNNNNNNNTNDRIHPAIREAVLMRLKIKDPTILQSLQIIRRSVDARKGDDPHYVYVVDVRVDSGGNHHSRWNAQPGRLERRPTPIVTSMVTRVTTSVTTPTPPPPQKPRVIIVGAGPAGLFCAWQLARSNRVIPIVIERGQAVETRGRDIGALMHRKLLNPESNFAFGEGGAGTWSDGKLTTRIGRNSEMVRTVLETFVQYGAPPHILIEGAPHLGTDHLVRLLRNMRQDLRRMGGIIQFGTKVTGLVMEQNVTLGVTYNVSRVSTERHVGTTRENHNNDSFQNNNINNNSGVLLGDAVVLATGHSARDVYEQLHQMGVSLEPKGFAVGFRVEHPQKLINQIQYGLEWGPSVVTGKGTTDTENVNHFASLNMPNETLDDNNYNNTTTKRHRGTLPVPSYRLATDQANDGKALRGVYSFCMCPGGQIVPASTEPNEVCVNGMSFSRRDSPFANSALVVTVNPNDEILEPYRAEHGILAGIAFQRDMERRAAEMGGGNFTVPVQRLTDFLSNIASTSAPPSSYRLGVKPAPCHLIYPEPLVVALKHALTNQFNRQMPGFICDNGLLHGVETRTSSPVRIVRDGETFQAMGTKNLFPAGEGAGFAGGIVSAAVDGIAVADAILSDRFGFGNEKSSRNDGITVGTTY